MTPPDTIRLHPEDVAAIAAEVARLLAGAQPAAGDGDARLLSAAEVAERFAVSVAWVRQNADRLGVVRIGGGPRSRLRFDPAAVAEVLAAAAGARSGGKGSDPREPPLRRARRASSGRRTGTGVKLLPIQGSKEVP